MSVLAEFHLFCYIILTIFSLLFYLCFIIFSFVFYICCCQLVFILSHVLTIFIGSFVCFDNFVIWIFFYNFVLLAGLNIILSLFWLVFYLFCIILAAFHYLHFNVLFHQQTFVLTFCNQIFCFFLKFHRTLLFCLHFI